VFCTISGVSTCVPRHEEERVAVRARLGDGIRADDGKATRAVVDDHGLSEHGAQLLGKRSRNSVGAAPRAEGDDKPDRPVGVALRERRLREREQGERE